MAASNQFLPFATAAGANALTPTNYASLTSLIANGFLSGRAPSVQFNTVLRQSSFVASAIAQAMADQLGIAINDDGIIANFEGQFLNLFQAAPFRVASAGGTADAITASFNPPITTLTDGMTIYVRAAYANATGAPTFTPNSGIIAAATIVNSNAAALAAGDISGAGHWLKLTWDATLLKWVLGNPASVLSSSLASTVPAATGTVMKIPFRGSDGTTRTVFIQIGSDQSNASGVVTVTLPLAFPNAALGAWATHNAATAGAVSAQASLNQVILTKSLTNYAWWLSIGW